MPRHRSRAADLIEQDFLAAIERLKVGQPRHPKHKEWLKKRGSVPINISSVAREAGRARGLIATEATKYQKVRNLVLLEAGEMGVEPGNRQDVVADLRAQVAELRAELRSAREHAAYHFKLRSEAEKRLQELLRRYERLKKKLKSSRQSGSVVRLFPENE
ncbi:MULTISPECIES: hypothetical protein [Thioclava]|uniref:hypothetical protein n=1 Tax=Thioclava TaxID=285107 RepID=UPI000B53EFC0|nr:MULTISPECIES: hypothetical protein [Thioclava]MBC7146556.1 hypothetical protein [Thioclava marina]OWY04024.1 hypothetical protein B6V76_05675 [Thioclava sp. IC9]